MPCMPDCYEDPFGPTQLEYFGIGGDPYDACIIRVWFTCRIACGTYYDIQVLKIEAITPACSLYTDREILEFAFYNIVKNDYCRFSPRLGFCNLQYRISIAPCYTIDIQYPEPDHPVRVLVPCTDSACCVQTYMVCNNGGGNITMTPIGEPQHPYWDCIFAIPPPGFEGFYTLICDWLWIERFQPPVLVKPYEQESESIRSTLKVSVLNQEGGNISANSTKVSNYLIKITDVYGTMHIEQTGEVGTDFNQILIDVSRLRSGFYVYNLYVDGVLKRSGKFAIIK